jgi:pimeloyl-ACP methyl ester carboxylesterase
MRRWFTWLCTAMVLLLLTMAAAYTVNRLLLAPSSSGCHADITRNLQLFDPSREGLVRIRASGMEFRARIAGFRNGTGEGVVLLHGFAETSIMWEPLLDKLAKAGFRVIAFDQRGYSPGARPFRTNAYTSGRLAADVIAVATAVGFDRFHVVGHDFGGAIAWIAADRFPREIFSVTSLSTPHPAALAEALSDPDAQWLHSSYVLLNWIPMLPELVLGFNEASYLQHSKWRYHPPEQIEEYKCVFSKPGALRAALDWYRAFRFESHDPLGKIRQPTLFLWGNEDGAFGRVAAEKTANYVDGPFRFHRLKAGHFLMLEVPNVVAGAVLSHLQTWSEMSERWKLMLAIAPQEDASPCDQSRPHCLNILVTPSGDAVRIRNRCSGRHRGAIRVTCSGWDPQAFIEYRFNLGAKADIIQETSGFSFGDCYYRHRLCSIDDRDP